MVFRFNKDQHAACWLLLILSHVALIVSNPQICDKAGNYKCHPDNPQMFYQCSGFQQGYLIVCAGSLNFDPIEKVCNWPNDNDCRAKIHHSRETSKSNNVAAATKPITTSVVTTEAVPFKRTSLPRREIATSYPLMCDEAGSYKCHPNDPQKFYHCSGFRQGTLKTCHDGQHFDPFYNVCSWPNDNDCGAKIHHSRETSKSNNVAAATKPITTSVVTTEAVPFKRTSLPRREIASACDPPNCKLPNCKCPGDEIPGSLSRNSTPQIILLTFDDGINWSNIRYYRKLLDSNITNPNGCPINATFFVSGDYINPAFVKELHRNGHEIASHSITHQNPYTKWLEGSRQFYVKEIVGMKQYLISNASIPEKDIRGMRSPFLAMGGNNQFDVLQDYGFQYDSSMVAGSLKPSDEEDPVWPFTLDYKVNSTYCALTNCPTKSYPGLWEVPLIRWYNENKKPCSMPDDCLISNDKPLVEKYLMDNFDRHYKRNRAPFGIFLHAPWLKKNLKPLKTFLKEISKKEDVWMVSVSQALQWIRNPVPLKDISQVKSWSCK